VSTVSETPGGLHHVELWVPDLTRAREEWGWLLGQLGYEPLEEWADGFSWRLGGTYLVLEQSPAPSVGHHDRLRPGLNHLAFHAGPRGTVDALAAASPAHGWTLLFPDTHPHAGGPDHYAAYLANTDGFEVELVADESRSFRSAPIPTLRVVRASPGLVWRALDGNKVVGAVRAFLRPDHRWFVAFDTCREDSYAPLLTCVAEDVRGDLYAIASDADDQALDRFARLGFTVNRRESHYIIPTGHVAAGLPASAELKNIVIITALNADEDEIRLLDDALRQDVPGTAGWKWDPGDFREETFDSPRFDPATYLIAVDTRSAEYVGLVRVWNTPGRPRLGLIGVLRAYRRRGLATMLLAQVFRTLRQQDKAEVTAEVDDDNIASRSLLLRFGARRKSGFVEVVKSRRAGSAR
jgi:ribosomal protein S18 acetylase RimI-like enzyme